MHPDNIIFVKHGNKYSSYYVNKIANQLLKYYPAANFFCYTDDPINVNIPIIPVYQKPTLRFWWNKLAMFSEEFPVNGRCLYFDLDMNIKSDPSDYFNDYSNLTVINAYYKKNLYFAPHSYDVKINSSIMSWTAPSQSYIWKHFLSNKDYFMRKYCGIDRFIVYEKIQYCTFRDGIVNSVANPYQGVTPIDMYNGLHYEFS